LDVFYQEADSRIPKELVWAGDGIQVWLQLLYHVYRVQNCETIVLDEPEVYLILTSSGASFTCWRLLRVRLFLRHIQPK